MDIESFLFREIKKGLECSIIDDLVRAISECSNTDNVVLTGAWCRDCGAVPHHNYLTSNWKPQSLIISINGPTDAHKGVSILATLVNNGDCIGIYPVSRYRNHFGLGDVPSHSKHERGDNCRENHRDCDH